MKFMMRGIQIVVCLLLIVSVATILISPDQTDDVPGVLHHLVKFQKIFAVWAPLFSPLKVLANPVSSEDVLVQPLDTPPLLTLLCVRLC